MKQRIFILGASGNVWRELVAQIMKYDSKSDHCNPSKIVWIASSSYYIYKPSGISISLLKKIASSKKDAQKIFSQEWKKLNDLWELIDEVKSTGLNWEVVFADVTAWKQDLLDFHKKVLLESQNFLVTANKNPLSLFSMDDFNELTSFSGRYDTNTTVMWWAGVLNFVYERSDLIRDSINKIEWIFSWTLWYILSELDSGEKKFSDIVREAKSMGYTEPNPWDDLNGLDVARKLIILARYAGIEIEMSEVKVEPLISEEYAQHSWEDFLQALEKEDSRFTDLIEKWKKENTRLRYVWEIKIKKWKATVKVGLASVDALSDMWGVSGTSNIAIVETDILSDPLPHVIKSRGAWLEVTAWSVRVGIAKMLPSYLPTK